MIHFSHLRIDFSQKRDSPNDVAGMDYDETLFWSGHFIFEWVQLYVKLQSGHHEYLRDLEEHCVISNVNTLTNVNELLVHICSWDELLRSHTVV